MSDYSWTFETAPITTLHLQLWRGGAGSIPPAPLDFTGTQRSDLLAACANALGCDAKDVTRLVLSVGGNEVEVTSDADVAQMRQQDRLIAWLSEDADGIVGERTRETRDREGRAAAVALDDEQDGDGVNGEGRRVRARRELNHELDGARGASGGAGSSGGGDRRSAKERLSELKQLFDDGLISQEKYEQHQERILSQI